jgi:putative PIN family toxin of toxin-antitoxin system
MAGNPGVYRVVLDTNIFVSGLLAPHGAPAALLTEWRQGAFTLLISAWQRAELATVLARPVFARKYGLTDERVAAIMFLVDTLALTIEPMTALPLTIRDPKDVPILGMALAGDATHLVTGDDDLLVLAGDPALGSLRIVPPRVFLSDIAPREGESNP